MSDNISQTDLQGVADKHDEITGRLSGTSACNWESIRSFFKIKYF